MTEVHSERRGDTAVLTLDSPPVNALGVPMLRALTARLGDALSDPAVKGIVVTGAGRAFVGGADIREFGKPRPADAPSLSDVIARIEGADKPVVAAINGACAGGGLELALACHARVASSKARIGLPEVKLGLVPGAGGTQRLPRLIGVEPRHQRAQHRHAQRIDRRAVEGEDRDVAAPLAVNFGHDVSLLACAERGAAAPAPSGPSSCWRSTRLATLPVAVRGISSRNTTSSGMA